MRPPSSSSPNNGRRTMGRDSWTIQGHCVLCFFLVTSLVSVVVFAAEHIPLTELQYRNYPRRTTEEAAVLEWGHSAIISALDASVAHFGPQMSDAALFEVEAMPILASPINGVWPARTNKKTKKVTKKIVNDEGEEIEVEVEEEAEPEPKIRPLDNAEEVHGNLVVMTNTGKELTGVEMAKIAQESGAAALLVVNTDEEFPEDIYRLPAEEGAEDIQIPVVMVSLNSANALTTATVTPDMKQRDIVNNGMPDRVRLYAGGDRPFFEDVEATDPTVYLIHNLLTDEECDSLLEQAKKTVSPVTQKDALQLSPDPSKLHNVDRVMLWQGMLMSPARKQIEERIEQVTGFPADHFSEFVVDRLQEGSYWEPQYDTIPGVPGSVPLASVTIFLTEVESGGELVFPSTMTEALKIRPTKGMAVVHHNTDENHEFDVNSIHGLLPPSGELYVARKFVLPVPVSKARRIALPAFAFFFGGRLPRPVVMLHDFMVDQFEDYETAGKYFDKLCVFLPLMIVFSIVQYAATYVHKQFQKQSSRKVEEKTKRKKTDKKKKQ